MKRTTFSGGMAALILVCCRSAPAPETTPAVSVHCAAPQRVSLDETVTLRGRIAPMPGASLQVASQVPGRVLKVTVREGEKLAAGQVVAVIDDLAARDAARQAEAALAQAQASQANAELTLTREQALVARGIAPRQELENAQAQAAAARAATKSAAAAADLARRTLGRVQVRSSFDGVVTHVLRGPGALVDGTALTPVIELAASTIPEFVADASERDLSNVAVGQVVVGELPTEAIELKGTVRARSTALDPLTGLGSVRVALEELPAGTPLQAFGQVKITTRHRDGVRVLPNEALRGAVEDGAEVAVCGTGKAEIRTVKIGYRDERRFEVLAGIGDQDRVAVDHVLGLKHGTLITEVR